MLSSNKITGFKKSGFIRLTFIITALASSFYFISEYSPDVDITRLLNSRNVHFLGIAFACVFFHFTLEPWRWFLYISTSKPINDPSRAGYLKVLAVMSTVALISCSMPFKLGIPSRLYLVNQYLSMATSRIIYLLAIDGAINILTWGILGSLCLLYVLPLNYFAEHSIFIIIAAGLFALVVYFAAKPVRNIVKPFFTRDQHVPLKTVLQSVIVFIVDIAVIGIRHVAIFYFLGITISIHDAMIIGILSVFAGIASTLPMGLGAYDATLVFLLSRYGAPIEIAGLAPLMNRILELTTSVIFGGISSLILLKHTVIETKQPQ